MGSLRNHRVVIASLFLPTTAVLGESAPTTPEIPSDRTEFLPKFPSGGSGEKPSRVLPTHNHHSSVSSITLPIKSIVEDLQDKVRIPNCARRPRCA